jgi:hypothetical protein
MSTVSKRIATISRCQFTLTLSVFHSETPSSMPDPEVRKAARPFFGRATALMVVSEGSISDWNSLACAAWSNTSTVTGQQRRFLASR